MPMLLANRTLDPAANDLNNLPKKWTSAYIYSNVFPQLFVLASAYWAKKQIPELLKKKY